MLQCVAVHCSFVRRGAVWCSVVQCDGQHYLRMAWLCVYLGVCVCVYVCVCVCVCVYVWHNFNLGVYMLLQCVAVCCNVLQCVAICMPVFVFLCPCPCLCLNVTNYLFWNV